MKQPPLRYKDPRREPEDMSLWLLGKVGIQGDPTPTDAQIERLGRALWDGDPLADAVIGLFQQIGHAEGYRLLDQALDRGIASIENPPEELAALFAQVERVPFWVNWDAIDRASAVGLRTGLSADIILSCVSLMGGYRSGAGNKPISFTGALDYNTARRLGETSKFVFDVYQPGGMHPGGAGYRSCIKVRLMHAQVRAMLNKSDKWNAQEWGTPINQADLLGTNLLFSSVFLSGLRLLGYRFSIEDSKAIMSIWRYAGYLLGIDEDLLPADEEEGLRTMYLNGMTQPPADEDSRLLGAALTNVPRERAKNGTSLEKALAEVEVHFRSGVSRLILGDQAADDLGLENNYFWKFAPLLISPLVFGAETLRQNLPGLNKLAVKLGTMQAASRVDKVTAEGGPVTFTQQSKLRREESYAS